MLCLSICALHCLTVSPHILSLLVYYRTSNQMSSAGSAYSGRSRAVPSSAARPKVMPSNSSPGRARPSSSWKKAKPSSWKEWRLQQKQRRQPPWNQQFTKRPAPKARPMGRPAAVFDEAAEAVVSDAETEVPWEECCL